MLWLNQIKTPERLEILKNFKLDKVDKITISMKKAANNLDFERAAEVRDLILRLNIGLTVKIKNQGKN
ncbi:UvrB/UvrC motif-containing protein [Candidatus Parcubacteria bacterium]|nr:UvrB/UvrC motif-containing protein [Candidatus Parcubacteria bacterium]